MSINDGNISYTPKPITKVDIDEMSTKIQFGGKSKPQVPDEVLLNELNKRTEARIGKLLAARKANNPEASHLSNMAETIDQFGNKIVINYSNDGNSYRKHTCSPDGKFISNKFFKDGKMISMQEQNGDNAYKITYYNGNGQSSGYANVTYGDADGVNFKFYDENNNLKGSIVYSGSQILKFDKEGNLLSTSFNDSRAMDDQIAYNFHVTSVPDFE